MLESTEEALTLARGLQVGAAVRDKDADDKDDHEPRKHVHDACNDADILDAHADERHAGMDGEQCRVSQGMEEAGGSLGHVISAWRNAASYATDGV